MTVYTHLDPADHADGTTMASLGWTDYKGRLSDGSALQPTAPNWRVAGGGSYITATTQGPYFYPWPRVLFDVGGPFVRGQALLRQGDSCTVLALDEYNFIQMTRVRFGEQDQIGFTIFVNGYESNTGAGSTYTADTVLDSNVLTVTGLTGSSRVEAGAAISGPGIPAGTKILSNGTGTGLAGTYTMSANATATASAVTITQPIWYDYYARYQAGSHYNQYEQLPTVANITWLVVGSTLLLYLDGVQQKLRFHTDLDFTLPSAPIPAFMAGARKAGYNYGTFGTAQFCYPVTYRDNYDYIEIRQIATVRFDATTSGLRIPFFCNIAGSTSIYVTVKASDGTDLGNNTTNVIDDVGTASISQIPKIYEGDLLQITAHNLDGSVSDTSVVYFMMPATITQQATQIGQNASYINYYTPGYPFNDLAKCSPWESTTATGVGFGVPFILLPWQDPALYPTCWPASYAGLQDNGSPTAFPGDGTSNLGMRLPWYGEPGDYVLNLSEAPSVNFEITAAGATIGSWSLTLDAYGPHLHKLSINSVPVTNLFLILKRNTGATNNGMPTAPWLLYVNKYGASGSWNARFLNWSRRSATRQLRLMSDQFCNEPVIGIPFDTLTSARRARRSSQTWGNGDARPTVPIEVMIEGHNALKKDLWLNVTRVSAGDYNQELAQLIRDELDPTLKVVLAKSNEVWNFGFVGQRAGYQNYGVARGLGRPGASIAVTANTTSGSNMITVTGGSGIAPGSIIAGAGIPAGTVLSGASFLYSTTSGSPTLTVTSLTGGIIETGGVLSGTGIASGASISFPVTGIGGVGTYTMSANATSTQSGLAGVQRFGSGTGTSGTYRMSANATATATAVPMTGGGAAYGADNGTWPTSYGTWTNGASYALNAMVFDEVGTIKRAKTAVTPVVITANTVSGSNVLTVTAVASGTIEPNARLACQTADILPPTTTHPNLTTNLVFPLSGTGTGGTGTYIMDQPADATATGVTIYANVPPYQDALRWGVVQTTQLAIYRAHIEDSQRLWNDFITVFGTQEAFLARCHPALEVWRTFLAEDGQVYLEWGDNISRGAVIATGTYFGGDIMRYGTASSDVRNAILNLSGSARRAVFRDAIHDQALLEASQYRASVVAFGNMLESAFSLPTDAVPVWSYEGGADVRTDFDNPTLASYGVGPIDQSVMRTDWIYMWRFDFETIYEDYYAALADNVGGWVNHFDSFYDMNASWPTPDHWVGDKYTFQQNFGISLNADDLDYDAAGPSGSSRFTGLKTVSLAHGGVVPGPAVPRRRAAPQVKAPVVV